MISIHSEEENSFVHGIAEGYDLWLGAIANNRGQFRWKDGTVNNFTKWYNGHRCGQCGLLMAVKSKYWYTCSRSECKAKLGCQKPYKPDPSYRPDHTLVGWQELKKFVNNEMEYLEKIYHFSAHDKTKIDKTMLFYKMVNRLNFAILNYAQPDNANYKRY